VTHSVSGQTSFFLVFEKCSCEACRDKEETEKLGIHALDASGRFATLNAS